MVSNLLHFAAMNGKLVPLLLFILFFYDILNIDTSLLSDALPASKIPIETWIYTLYSFPK